MMSVALPISHRVKFAIQLVIVSMSFHLLQSAQFLVNLLYAFSKNQIGEIAILAHIVLAVKTRIEV